MAKTSGSKLTFRNWQHRCETIAQWLHDPGNDVATLHTRANGLTTGQVQAFKANFDLVKSATPVTAANLVTIEATFTAAGVNAGLPEIQQFVTAVQQVVNPPVAPPPPAPPVAPAGSALRGITPARAFMFLGWAVIVVFVLLALRKFLLTPDIQYGIGWLVLCVAVLAPMYRWKGWGWGIVLAIGATLAVWQIPTQYARNTLGLAPVSAVVSDPGKVDPGDPTKVAPTTDATAAAEKAKAKAVAEVWQKAKEMMDYLNKEFINDKSAFFEEPTDKRLLDPTTPRLFKEAWGKAAAFQVQLIDLEERYAIVLKHPSPATKELRKEYERLEGLTWWVGKDTNPYLDQLIAVQDKYFKAATPVEVKQKDLDLLTSAKGFVERELAKLGTAGSDFKSLQDRLDRKEKQLKIAEPDLFKMPPPAGGLSEERKKEEAAKKEKAARHLRVAEKRIAMARDPKMSVLYTFVTAHRFKTLQAVPKSAPEPEADVFFSLDDEALAAKLKKENPDKKIVYRVAVDDQAALFVFKEDLLGFLLLSPAKTKEQFVHILGQLGTMSGGERRGFSLKSVSEDNLLSQQWWQKTFRAPVRTYNWTYNTFSTNATQGDGNLGVMSELFQKVWGPEIRALNKELHDAPETALVPADYVEYFCKEYIQLVRSDAFLTSVDLTRMRGKDSALSLRVNSDGSPNSTEHEQYRFMSFSPRPIAKGKGPAPYYRVTAEEWATWTRLTKAKN